MWYDVRRTIYPYNGTKAVQVEDAVIEPRKLEAYRSECQGPIWCAKSLKGKDVS